MQGRAATPEKEEDNPGIWHVAVLSRQQGALRFRLGNRPEEVFGESPPKPQTSTFPQDFSYLAPNVFSLILSLTQNSSSVSTVSLFAPQQIRGVSVGSLSSASKPIAQVVCN